MALRPSTVTEPLVGFLRHFRVDPGTFLVTVRDSPVLLDPLAVRAPTPGETAVLVIPEHQVMPPVTSPRAPGPGLGLLGRGCHRPRRRTRNALTTRFTVRATTRAATP